MDRYCILPLFTYSHAKLQLRFTCCWATVYKTVRPIGTLSVCVSVSVSDSLCPVTLVYCGQTVGWIKMPLGMEVGLFPCDIVLDGAQLPPRKGAQQSSHFSAHVYCGQTAGYQDATWYGDRRRPKSHCVRWGPTTPPQKGAQHPPLLRFMDCVRINRGSCLFWRNGRPSQLLQSAEHLLTFRRLTAMCSSSSSLGVMTSLVSMT